MKTSLFMLLLLTKALHAAENKSDNQVDHKQTKTPAKKEPQPNMELLLFLAEFRETQDGEWIDPLEFTESDALKAPQPQKTKGHEDER